VSSIHPVHPEMLPSTEQVLELLRTRRSVREFRAKAVEKEVIETIIEGARFAPSAHNVQSTEFVVIQEKAVLSQVVALTVDYLRNLVKNLRNPLIRQIYRLIAGKEIQAAIDGLEELTEVIHHYEGGEDIILHDAPTLLLFHANRSAMFAGVNANLALQNATLVCQTLGLGNFYTGFVIAACDRDKRIAKLLELPPDHKIYGGLAIGYPKFRYPHWIERKPARIQWR
jgi:nitroreductase